MWECAPIGAFSKKKKMTRRHCATDALSAAVAQFRRQSRTAASPAAHTVPTAASGRTRSRTYRSKAAAAPSAAPQPRKWTTSSASGRHLCASTRGPSNRAEHLFFFFLLSFFLILVETFPKSDGGNLTIRFGLLQLSYLPRCKSRKKKAKEEKYAERKKGFSARLSNCADKNPKRSHFSRDSEFEG